jgi:hypothetical protein
VSDSVLKRYAGQTAEDRFALSQGESLDAANDLGAFGWLRGVRDRAVMLELRKKNGNITAIGYAWLERAEFDPSEGITLFVMGQKIRIKGRNLNAETHFGVRLYQGITRHRVPWIREAGEATRFTDARTETIVESIG